MEKSLGKYLIMKKLLPLVYFLALFGCKDHGTSIGFDEPMGALPSASIYIDDSLSSISSKEYVLGTFDLSSENKAENILADISIRGRGNST